MPTGASFRSWAPTLTAALAGAIAPAAVAQASPSGMPVLGKLVYAGNAGCAGAKCHSADAPTDQSGQLVGDELNLWEGSDPHSKAFKTLGNAKSKEIATKLGLASAAADARCLSCHSMDGAPKEQRKPEFKHTVGVGCEACHGPAEKYLEPHKQAGWTAAQRKTLDAKGMADTWGIIDTAHSSVRARMCVACHLQIDKDMIDAGHPALRFELGWYDTYNYNADWQPHWTNPKKSAFRASLWAVGQAASLEAAKAQSAAWKAKGWATADAESLEALYAKGASIAKATFGADTPDALEKAGADGAKAASAAKALAATAADAKTKEQREIVLFGVASLTTATFEARGESIDENDAFWAAFEEAEKAEGASFVAAVGKLAAMAK